MRIAREARDRIFVHAGVVAQYGRRALLPGSSFTGKTTLVAALVRAGATYYSDEYAALDSDGLVHPYPKPLSTRDGKPPTTGTTRRSTGWHRRRATLSPCVPSSSLPIAAAPNGHPSPLDPGDGALALLAHAVPAQDRPAESRAPPRRAVEGALSSRATAAKPKTWSRCSLAALEARAV